MIDEYTICDEEKSFYNWLSKIIIKQYDVALVKKAFVDGYAAGFDARGKYSAEEQLQK
jgi:hypothetical protein